MRYCSWIVVVATALTGISCTKTENAPPRVMAEQVLPQIPIDTSSSLFSVIQNGRLGFVNTSGHIVIKPRFRQVGNFSFGVAPAREVGRYGYINSSGEWTISPIYDYATDFSEGLAAVFRNGLAEIINVHGTVVHRGAYKDVKPFSHGLSIVTSELGRGLVTAQGKLIVEPGPARFYVLSRSRILVNELHAPNGKVQMEPSKTWKLIDAFGGTIKSLKGYSDVVAEFGAPHFLLEKQIAGTITGRYDMFSTNGVKIKSIYEDFVDVVDEIQASGYMRASKTYVKNGWSSSVSHIIDSHGEIRQLMVGDEHIALFGRSLLVGINRTTNLLRVFNTSGGLKKMYQMHTRSCEIQSAAYNQLDNSYTSLFHDRVQYGMIESESAYKVLDENGRISGALQLSHNSRVEYLDSSHVVVAEPFDESDLERLQFFDWDGRADPVATYDSLEKILSISHGVVSAVIASRQYLIDLYGRTIWKSKKGEINSMSESDLDHKREVCPTVNMSSARKIQYSSLDRDLARNNLRLNIDRDTSVHVYALPTNKSLADTNTIQVVVANNKSVAVDVSVSDGRLWLVMEARKSPRDQWTEIEYQPDSWCGNSYYSVALPPHSYWSFNVIRSTGDDRVECRMKLTNRSPILSGSKSTMPFKVLYSNTFWMTTNPGQFWRIRQHRSSGLMDPY